MNADELYKKMKQDSSKTWYTIKDLSSLAERESNEVVNVVNDSDLFVRSSFRSQSGEQLFTTKDDFQVKASFGTKILGAFKNRID